MNGDNPGLGDPTPSGGPAPGPVDFAYLDAQTLADRQLERELLDLFVAQAQRLVPALPALPDQRQSDTIHLLKGSARGIGAWAAAAAAEAYEAAPAARRALAYPALVEAFASAERTIAARLAERPA